MLLLFAKRETVCAKENPWVLHSTIRVLKELNNKKRPEMVDLLYRKASVPPLALPARLEAQQLIPQFFCSAFVK